MASPVSTAHLCRASQHFQTFYSLLRAVESISGRTVKHECVGAVRCMKVFRMSSWISTGCFFWKERQQVSLRFAHINLCKCQFIWLDNDISSTAVNKDRQRSTAREEKCCWEKETFIFSWLVCQRNEPPVSEGLEYMWSNINVMICARVQWMDSGPVASLLNEVAMNCYIS